MSNQPKNRQELYDRIRESSKDEVILEEMIRLGFWPSEGKLPQDPADEVRRRAALENELRDLRTQSRRLNDIEAMKQEARKRRMAESRQRQKETRERRQKERLERTQVWKEKKSTEIGYLGKGVSGGLSNTESDTGKLTSQGLPVLHTSLDLATAMGVSVSDLRFLAFTRTTSKISHYVRFYIPKRNGGKRLISAPLDRLKTAQDWILRNILSPISTHDAAHGFVPKRSIVSNATPHIRPELLVNLDLKDFFPTITYKRVKGLFHSMGFSEALATILGLICTEPRTRQVLMDGDVYHVSVEERVLPQGSPASPAITNLICRGLDCRLSKIADDLGMTYTRYADDMSFSGSRDANVGKLLRQVKYIVSSEGFTVHPEKNRVFRKPGRQEVTGIVVNEKPNINRTVLRRFRATLFQIEKDGPVGKKWGKGSDVIASVEGFANYVAMVNPEKGKPLQARTRELVKRYGKKAMPMKHFRSKTEQPVASESSAPDPFASGPPSSGSTESAEKSEKKKSWWKIW